MSARAAARWLRAPGFAREVLGSFRLFLAQSMADAERLEDLGAADVGAWGNLKFAAPPLPADPGELDRLRGLLAGRPVLLAASTHPGEEAIVAEAHRRLAPAHPGLLLLVVPRHPPRGAEVAATLAAAGLRTTRRSLGQDPGPEDAAHVADTLGELGLFYRLAGVALVGGSLVPHGGQNPLEPARLGCPILLGPHTWNFAEPVLRLVAAGGAEIVSAGGARVLPAGPDPAGALAEAAGAVLSDGTRARKMAAAAAAVADDASGLPDRIAAAVLDLLPPPPEASAPGQASPVAAGSPGPVA
jgi:3-deoxy-D-manno-octulosonic-acid transferase